MKNLSTKQLIEIYNKAKALNLSQEFINLLRNEIDNRNTEKVTLYYKLRIKDENSNYKV
jgi:Sporulation inhibitor A